MQKKALNLSRSHQTVFKNTKSKVEYQANFGDSSGAIFFMMSFLLVFRLSSFTVLGCERKMI